MKNKKRSTILWLTAVIAVAGVGGWCLWPFVQQPDVPDGGGRVVVCIPVYGQSLALGEEAVRRTHFDRLRHDHQGRIVTERMDYQYGYQENSSLKHFLKRLLRYRRRAFELSVYAMADRLAERTGSDTLICVFAGGQGATGIAHLGKGTLPYTVFVENIRLAQRKATQHGWRFSVPAVCWMQGETDIVDREGGRYRERLLQFAADIDRDVRDITGQQDTVRLITYQTNAVTHAPSFSADRPDAADMAVPQTLLSLACGHPLFTASGPTYPYTFVDERIHIDAVGQQSIGTLAAEAALRLLRHGEKSHILAPRQVETDGTEVTVHLSVPCPPLQIDTVLVSKAAHYGFSVRNAAGDDILLGVQVDSSTVRLHCREAADGCTVNYAVNGQPVTCGRLHGPRGNLRDLSSDSLSSGGGIRLLHHWCWQFLLPTGNYSVIE